jgi:protein gp37
MRGVGAREAAMRFLSIEPLLEDLGALDLSSIHWVIVGGESGHGARPPSDPHAMQGGKSSQQIIASGR